MAAKFVVYKDKGGQFRWRFISSNGRIIAVASEGYKSKADCEHGIELIKTDGKKAKIEELEE